MRSQEEDFEQWDDYIEWATPTKTKHSLEIKLEDLENAQDINSTQG